MKFRFVVAAVLLCLASAASAQAQGKEVFLVPNTGDIRVFTGDLGTVGTITSQGPDVLDIFATPDGTRYIIVTKNVTNSVSIVRTPIGSVPPTVLGGGGAVDAAALTSDGATLVLASQTLRVIDVANATEVLISGIPGGALIKDVALSPDNRYAYALAPGSSAIYQLNLISRSAERTAIIDPTATNVSVSRAGHVYVSGPNMIKELDGRNLGERGQFIFSGLSPSKLYFTPDLKYALTINQSGRVAAALLLDLTERKQAGNFSILGTLGEVQSLARIHVVDTRRAIAWSADAGRIYDLQFSNLPATSPELNLTGGPPVYGFAVSEETPLTRTAYISTSGEMRRVTLATGTVTGSIFSNDRGRVFRAGRSTTGMPTELQIVNTGITAAPGTQVLLSARAVDLSGAPLTGVPLTFSTTTPNAMIESQPQVLTKGDGWAAAVVTLPTTAGTVVVQVASNNGLARTYEITVANPTGGGGTGGGGGGTGGTAQVRKISGDGQILRVGLQPSADLTIRVLGTDGKPLAGQTVTWAGSFDVMFIGNTTGTTDSVGEARIGYFLTGVVQQGANFNQYSITAQTPVGNVAFAAVGLAPETWDPIIFLLKPDAIDRRITVKSGETLNDGVQATITTNVSPGGSSGLPMPNVGVYLGTGNAAGSGVTVSCQYGAALSNEMGTASCNVIGGPIVGNSQATVAVGSIRNFLIDVTVQPGSPTSLRVVAGDNQETLFNQDFPRVLVVRVADAGGNGLADVPVAWTVVQSTGVSILSFDSKTDLNGEARARVRGGAQDGAFQVQATAGGLTAAFNLRVRVPLGAFTKVSGDNQATVIVGRDFPDPLVVQVTNAAGTPASGVTVLWEIVSGSAQLSSTSSMTGLDGRSSIRVTAGALAGPILIRANVVSLNPVTFNLSSRPAGPEGLAVRTMGGFFSGLVSGGWAILTGRSLTSNLTGTVYSNLLATSLPTTLAGIAIEFGGAANIRAPIYSVSNVGGNESVVFLVPWELGEGVAAITVRVGDGSSTLSNVLVRRHYPAILETTDSSGRTVPFILRSDGQLVTTATPARRGEQLLAYGINMGQTVPRARTNTLGSASHKLDAATAIGIGSIAIYGDDVSVILSPQFIGIYEITFKVPVNADLGSFVPFGMQVVPPGLTPLFTQDNLTLAISDR